MYIGTKKRSFYSLIINKRCNKINDRCTGIYFDIFPPSNNKPLPTLSLSEILNSINWTGNKNIVNCDGESVHLLLTNCQLQQLGAAGEGTVPDGDREGLSPSPTLAPKWGNFVISSESLDGYNEACNPCPDSLHIFDPKEGTFFNNTPTFSSNMLKFLKLSPTICQGFKFFLKNTNNFSNLASKPQIFKVLCAENFAFLVLNSSNPSTLPQLRDAGSKGTIAFHQIFLIYQ